MDVDALLSLKTHWTKRNFGRKSGHAAGGTRSDHTAVTRRRAK